MGSSTGRLLGDGIDNMGIGMKPSLGGTIDNLLDAMEGEVRNIIVAGHGPPTAPEARRFHKKYPEAHIYCFEPQSDLYRGCVDLYEGEDWIHIYPWALGNLSGTKTLHVAKDAGWSSLQDFNECWIYGSRPREVAEHYRVDVVTVDWFCRKQGIRYLDLLFLDVQNYEHLVFLGADDMLRGGRIGVCVGESIFTNLHGDVHSFHKAYELLAIRNGYTFVGWYRPTQRVWGRVMFCDYIFAREDIVEGAVHAYG